MPSIYLTENLFNKSLDIEPWQYVGSDQYDRPDYFGSSLDLKSDIARLGAAHFNKTVIAQYFDITNKELRKLEAVELKKMNVKKDSSYYNKSDLYAPGGGVKGMKHSKKFDRTDAWKNSRKGWEPTEETRDLWREQRTGRVIKDETKELWKKNDRGNSMRLDWTVTTPDGTQYSVKGLRPWCRDNNINFYDVYEQRNGWKSIKHGTGVRSGSKNKRKVNE